MVQLARGGTSVKELARDFGVHDTTVRTYLYRSGLTPWEMREIAGKRAAGVPRHKGLRRRRIDDVPTAAKGRL